MMLSKVLRRSSVVTFASFASVFGIAVPAFAKPKPEAFGTLPLMGDAAISPDGTELAVFIRIEGEPGIRIIPVDGKDQGKPRVVRLGKGAKPKYIIWANDDRVLASAWVSERLGRTPFTGTFLYTIDADTMDTDVLVRPTRNFRQYNDVIVDMLHDDPDHILMQFSDDDQNTPDIKRVNVATGRYDTVRRGKAYVQNWYTDQRGEPRIGQGLKDSASGEERYYLTIRDRDEDKWRLVDDYPGLEADMDFLGFTANPDELIVRDNRGRDTAGIYIYNLASKSFGSAIYHNDDYDVGSVIMSDDGARIIGAKFIGEEAEVELFEENASAIQKMRNQFDAFDVTYVDQNDDGQKIVFKVSNGYTPPSLLMYDNSGNALYNYGSLYPGLKSHKLGLVSPVSYSSRDGTKIPAYLTLPPKVESGADVKNLPFIILPHGGPYARAANDFDYFAQFFATRGYAVLEMNFRGSEGYGESFKKTGRENWEIMLDDVEDGTRWLIEKGYADPDRICVAGWSFGGYAALMSAIRTPELYQCTVSMAGVTDLDNLVRDVRKYRFGNIAARNSILSGFDGWKDMRANSPRRRADEIKVPVFIAHGTLDQRVHFDHYTQMVGALRKAKVPTTKLEFKDEDHFLSNQKHRITFFVELDKFLTKNLGESAFAE